MTYLFNSNTNATISNEIEIKNDVGNAVPVVATINNGNATVSIYNPLPVTLGSGNIQIFGNTNIIDTVTVSSTPQNPVHVHLTELGSANLMSLSYMPISGNVIITSMPNITGTVNIQSTGNQGKLWTMQIAQGLIAGHTTEQVTGYNPTTSAGDAVWSGGTAYPWSSLTTAQTLYLKSSTNNATDRSMPILIDGLDSNYVNQTEVVTLDAADSRTPVTSTKQFLRIHSIMCNNANTNVGDITTHVTSGTGTLVSKISSGRGAAKAGVYTVPAGYTGYLFKGDASSTAATVVNFMGRYYGKAFMVLHVAIVDNSTYIYDFPFPLRLPEKTDMYTVIEAGSGKTAVNYEILLVAN